MFTKVCSQCGETKPLQEFSWKNKEAGTKQSSCKECHKAYRRKHYLENQERYKAKAVRWKQANQESRRNALREYIYQYLLKNPCVDCGESDPIVLEFDHTRDSKVASISTMVREIASIARLKQEIKKCEVRCANCHRRRTAEQFNWWISQRSKQDDPVNT